MQYIIYILLAIIIYVAWQLFKLQDEKIEAIKRQNNAIFWALKKKGILDMKEFKEGMKIAKGEKAQPIGLKDFMDLNKE